MDLSPNAVSSRVANSQPTDEEKKLIERVQKRFKHPTKKKVGQQIEDYIMRKPGSTLEGLADTDRNFLELAARECGLVGLS